MGSSSKKMRLDDDTTLQGQGRYDPAHHVLLAPPPTHDFRASWRHDRHWLCGRSAAGKALLRRCDGPSQTPGARREAAPLCACTHGASFHFGLGAIEGRERRTASNFLQIRHWLDSLDSVDLCMHTAQSHPQRRDICCRTDRRVMPAQRPVARREAIHSCGGSSSSSS